MRTLKFYKGMTIETLQLPHETVMVIKKKWSSDTNYDYTYVERLLEEAR